MRTLVIMRYRWFSAMSRNSLLLLTAVSASLVFGAACSNRVSPVKIRKEYAAVAAAVERHSDGFSIDESPEASVLLDREWSLQAAWVTAYLEDHPSATARQIERSVSDLGANLQCNATLLARGLYGIAIQKGEVGNVFVIAENHKRHRLVWNAKDLKPGTTRNSKLLVAWSARAANGQCRNKLKDEDWLNCGPLYGRFGILPDDDKGRRRFFLDGSYAEVAGLSAVAQLSVWVWDGAEPRPEFVGTYSYYIDQPVGTRLEGELLRVRVRAQYRTFSTCCDDEGRPMDWNLKLTPTGVEDLGYSPVPSPLEIVDEVFYRTAKGIRADDIAAPQVVAQARALVRRMPKESAVPAMGVLMPPYPNFVGDVAEVCVDLEGYGLALSIARVNGKPYLATMRQRTHCPAPRAQK
jgi:hypothetical protein